MEGGCFFSQVLGGGWDKCTRSKKPFIASCGGTYSPPESGQSQKISFLISVTLLTKGAYRLPINPSASLSKSAASIHSNQEIGSFAIIQAFPVKALFTGALPSVNEARAIAGFPDLCSIIARRMTVEATRASLSSGKASPLSTHLADSLKSPTR